MIPIDQPRTRRRRAPGDVMQYQAFDIVMLQPTQGSKIYAIVAVEPLRPQNAYVAVRLDKGPLLKRYRLGDDHILAKIGTLDPEALKLNPGAFVAPPSENAEIGQHCARFMAQQAPPSWIGGAGRCWPVCNQVMRWPSVVPHVADRTSSSTAFWKSCPPGRSITSPPPISTARSTSGPWSPSTSIPARSRASIRDRLKKSRPKNLEALICSRVPDPLPATKSSVRRPDHISHFLIS